MNKKSIFFWATSTFIAAFGIFLRFYKLGYQPLWGGELFTLHTISKNFSEMLAFLYYEETTNPPLYWVLNKLFTLPFSDLSESQLRLFSALSGAALLLLFPYVKRVFNSSIAAITFLIFTAFSVELIYYSQEARPYSFAILMSALASLIWADILKNGSTKKRLIGLTLVNVLLSYTHYYGCILITLQGIILLLRPQRQKYILSYLIPFILYLPIIKNVATAATSDFFLPKEPISKIIPVVTQIFNHSLFTTLIVIGSLSLLLIKPLRQNSQKYFLLGLLLTSLLFIQFLVVFGLSEFFTPFLRLRYFLILIPPVVLGLGLMYSHFRHSLVSLTLLCFVGTFIVYSLWDTNYYSEISKDDSRSVAEQIISWGEQYQDLTIMGCCHDSVTCNYYFKRLNSPLRIEYRSCSPQGPNQFLDENTTKEFIVFYDLGQSPDRELPDVNGYREIDSKDFMGAKAWLLKRSE